MSIKKGEKKEQKSNCKMHFVSVSEDILVAIFIHKICCILCMLEHIHYSIEWLATHST